MPLLRAPLPGAVRLVCLVGSLLSSPTGPLLPVAGLGLLMLVFLLVLVLVLLLVVGIGLVRGVFLLIVVHLVEPRALLASGGTLLVPLADCRPTVGSHCLAF